MIGWLRKIVTPHFDDDDLNRQAFNLNVVLLVLFVAILLGIGAMLFQIGQRPLSYMLPNTMFLVVAGLVLVLCYFLSRRGQVMAGSAIFVGMLILACVGAVAVGGTYGALPAILIIPVSIAGITLGSGSSVVLAVLSVVVLTIIGLLEMNGIIVVEYTDPQTTILLNIFDVTFGIFFATIGIWLAGYSLRQSLKRTQEAVVDTNRYRQDLESSLAAEEAVHQRLQRAIGEYTAFLEHIGHGDYEARLSLAEPDPALALLESQINATVDTLVAALRQSEEALQQAQTAQSRYVLQSWEHYRRTLPATEFEVGQPGAAPGGEGLRSALEMALERQEVVALSAHDGQNPASAAAVLGVPIKLRDQVIGVLGIDREDTGGTPWTEAEQALVAAVAERLAMTADGIRLLDDVQRRAARDRLLAETASRLRESLELETVLKSAANEIRQALDLGQVVVRLQPSDRHSRESGSPEPADRHSRAIGNPGRE